MAAGQVLILAAAPCQEGEPTAQSKLQVLDMLGLPVACKMVLLHLMKISWSRPNMGSESGNVVPALLI